MQRTHVVRRIVGTVRSAARIVVFGDFKRELSIPGRITSRYTCSVDSIGFNVTPITSGLAGHG